jgi:DNA-binding CsgD family transcriptional regulator
MNKPADDIVMVREQERQSILEAIESALAVRGQAQFLDWLGGPFRAVLPHDSIAFVEVAADDSIESVDGLQHANCDVRTGKVLSDAEHALAVRLAKYFHRSSQLPSVFDAMVISDLLLLESPPSGVASGSPGNAVVHRVDFMSGTSRLFVLFNVPQSIARRSRQLLRLLSAHFKMALSHALDLSIPGETSLPTARVELTGREREILGLMAQGQSNQQISAGLGISPITLKNHIRKLYRKLDVQHRAEAIVRFHFLEAPSRP